MKKEINDINFEPIIEKIASKSGLTIANIRNILTQNNDNKVAEFLNVKHADLDCIYSGEATPAIGGIFGLTNAEIQNLIDELGVNFVVGMLFSKIILTNE